MSQLHLGEPTGAQSPDRRRTHRIVGVRLAVLLIGFGVFLTAFPTNALAMPERGGRQGSVDVIQVDPSDFNQDLSGQIPASPGARPWAIFSWLGGTYLDPSGQDDIRGFRIYGSRNPGESVDFTNLVGSVPAYPGGWVADGFGRLFPWLGLSGPPYLGGFHGIQGAKQLLGLWPTLVKRELVESKVEVSVEDAR